MSLKVTLLKSGDGEGGQGGGYQSNVALNKAHKILTALL